MMVAQKTKHHLSGTLRFVLTALAVVTVAWVLSEAATTMYDQVAPTEAVETPIHVAR